MAAPKSESSSRKATITFIVCLLLALLMRWSNSRELARIDSMGVEAFLSQKRQLLAMPLPTLLLCMLAFAGIYRGLYKLVAYVLRHLFPDDRVEKPESRVPKPVRVSTRDWTVDQKHASGVTIDAETPPSSRT